MTLPTATTTLLLLFLLLLSQQPLRVGAFAASVSRPRVFKHLFRHLDDISFDSWIRCADPHTFLISIGYTESELEALQESYPKIWNQNVHSQLAPKVRFLVETCQGGEGQLAWANDDAADHAFDPHRDDDEPCSLVEGDTDESSSSLHTMRLWDTTKRLVPGSFYKCQLDRTVGPRHAYLVHHDIHPNGPELLQQQEETSDDNLFSTFLQASQSTEKFVELCNQWSSSDDIVHTAATLEAFEREFGPGLVPVAQGRHPLSIKLMLQHGANHLEHDSQDILPLHWAAGAGNEAGVAALLEAHTTAYDHELSHENDKCAAVVLNERTAKDGATSLHWACCGVHPGMIGGGGSYNVCRLLLEKSGERHTELANAATMYGRQSTPLHWAAWAGSTEIVDLLVLHGADPHAIDKHGANAAHYAAASGQLRTCRFLDDSLGVDFALPDASGQTPMEYAKSFDRQDVVEWLQMTSDRTVNQMPESHPQRAWIDAL